MAKQVVQLNRYSGADDWQVWQDTIFWLGNPTAPQASPVYMCGSGTVPGPIVPSSTDSFDQHVNHHIQQQPSNHHQNQQPLQDPSTAVYGTEEFIDLDMLINYVADQHSSGTNDPAPSDAIAHATDKSYYSCSYCLYKLLICGKSSNKIKIKTKHSNCANDANGANELTPSVPAPGFMMP
ncbi:Hypothetical protein CINCED_3A015469 [Cinara cedri]|uniref:Uncharacterized protein n=1 Tax=Cinara cedri TaxID=506608 RepID=A0A5E4MXP8_9HEMI|nr:Hypothetical protein CINCED_3A015469 [Cinara cedri]